MGFLAFLFHEAFANLKRHRLMTLAAITTISVALALLGGFVATFQQVHNATDRMISGFEMRVFCKAGIPPKEIAEIRKRIERLDGVATVAFLSREEIWAEQSKSYAIDISGLPNLMNDTFVVKLDQPQKAGAVAATVGNWSSQVEEVSLPGDEINQMLRIAAFVRNVGAVGIGVLLIGALAVVNNTIRVSVFSRRREIRIMQLVGATPWFIRMPLLIEGLLHGITGGILAALALAGMGAYVSHLVRDSVQFLAPYSSSVDMLSFGATLIALGALLGALGSLFSIRRYLRVL